MTKAEFIDSVLQILRSEFAAPESQPITAAKIGLQLRRSFGRPIWREHGFASLKPFLEEMERRGHLRIGRTDKDALAVQLGSSGQFKLETPKPDKGGARNLQRPLRKSFWIAFALEKPPGKRFINAKTGEVRFGLDDAPAPAEDWIGLEAISPATQKTWASEFLQEKNVESDDTINQALASEEWYREFPNVLNNYPGNLAEHWNRYRSKMIAIEAKNWCKRNGLAIDMAFQPKQKKEFEIGKIGLSLPAPAAANQDAWIRQIVLLALTSAPTDLLLELAIPMKYVLRALKTVAPRD